MTCGDKDILGQQGTDCFVSQIWKLSQMEFLSEYDCFNFEVWENDAFNITVYEV